MFHVQNLKKESDDVLRQLRETESELEKKKKAFRKPSALQPARAAAAAARDLRLLRLQWAVSSALISAIVVSSASVGSSPGFIIRRGTTVHPNSRPTHPA